MAYIADPVDVLTQAEARASVGYVGVDRDDILSMAVTALSRMMDGKFGPVVRRTITDEIRNGWSEQIKTLYAPVFSFTIVEHAEQAVTQTLTLQTFGTAATAATFQAEPWQTSSGVYSGRITLSSGGSFHQQVRLTYVAGRYLDTASVDRRFKQGAALALKNLWRAYEDSLTQVNEFTTPFQSFPAFGLPKAVIDLLRDEVRWEL